MSVGAWTTLTCRDAGAALRWLGAIGFTEHAVYRSEADPTVVEHAELLWPGGGGIMLGSVREGREQWPQQPGAAGVYLETDDPDRVHAAALAAGGASVDPVTDNDYGGRGGSVRDPEGNLWSFGSYRPR